MDDRLRLFGLGAALAVLVATPVPARAQFETLPGGGFAARQPSGIEAFDSDDAVNDQRASRGLPAIVAAPGGASAVVSASSRWQRRPVPKAGSGDAPVKAADKDCAGAGTSTVPPATACGTAPGRH